MKKQITLTLTQKCNLRCSYCYEENKSYNTMSWDVAKSILDKEFSNLKDGKYSTLEVDFFGGEPFFNFELLKKCVDYVTAEFGEYKTVFFVTTNGTLVHGEVQEWLLTHRDTVWCCLSLDGNKTMHDINRCNSFDQIDIDFFIKTWPNQEMKTTISQETLPYLAEGLIYMHKRGCVFSANLAHGIDWSDQDNKAILERELVKLIDYYIENPTVRPCSLLTIPIHKAAITEKVESMRQCGAGIEMTAYDVDGKAYPCQFFMPLACGSKAEKAGELVFKETIQREDLQENCRRCFAAPICHICYGSNYAATGDIFKKDENWCELQKIIFKANALYNAKLFELGRLKTAKETMPYLLKSILLLQEL